MDIKITWIWNKYWGSRWQNVIYWIMIGYLFYLNTEEDSAPDKT